MPNEDGVTLTPSTTNNCGNENVGTVMDKSVDSIGTCSLDVEASADFSVDWSEASSGGTLRSASFKTPSSDHHLPSYLSLACTVNGYSATTNYDPERLARSRDASPHRTHNDGLTPKTYPTYSIQNNLLSPPNLVPLPTHVAKKNKKIMADHTLAQHHQEFYKSSKTMTFQESHFQQHASNLFSTTTTGQDSVDACYENGGLNRSHVTSYESKNFTSSSTNNGQTTKFSSSEVQEYSNGGGDTTSPPKSFIQQRVERLYGPGALAQGFFVMKRQKNRESESDIEETTVESNGDSISSMKTSSSNPTLPVLRHLRPEFRAQLPFVVSPRRSTEGGDGSSSMQKSSTVPTLNDETKVNGESLQCAASEGSNLAQSVIAEETGEKGGHHFLKILQCEADRLLKKADVIERELENEELSEEVVGKIRSASGKARLLVNQKMQQFRGLCTNNITQVEGEAFPTTNEDLQGFWDMVMLQVDQVDNIFKEMDALKANNWQEPDEVDGKVKAVNGNNKMKKAVIRPKPTVGSEKVRKEREAQRKQMIEERRRAMKAQCNKPALENIEIFVPESS